MKKLNKILAIILAILMVISIIPITASAEDNIISGTEGDSYSWSFDKNTGTLTVTDEGAGQIYSYYRFTTGKKRPWEDVIHDVKYLVIDESIKYIGEYAFADADSLETVTMLGVETIDYNAFDCCQSLKSITVGNKLKSIYDSFKQCDKLTYIYYLGTQNEWDHVYLYDYYDILQGEVKVYPSDYVVYSGYGNCVGNLESDGLSWIFDANTYALTISGEGALPDIFSLIDLVGNFSYRFIGCRDWEFYKYDIKKVVVNDGVTYIGENYFRFLPHLTEVVIPATVTEIGCKAFLTSDAITDVYFKGTEEQWNAIIVDNDNETLLNATIHYNYVECEHNFETTVVTEPTCINRGYTTHICSICNESYVDSFLEFAECPDYVEVIWQPTCTTPGYISYECPVCHTGNVEEYLDPTTHSYEQTSVTQPTCTTQGYTTYTCTSCGKTVKDDYTSSFGHDYGGIENIVDPTCTSQGYTVQTCLICGYVGNTNTVPSLGHNYETVVTEPTCEEQGYTTYICTVCEYTTVDDYIESTEHVSDSWVVTKEPTCTRAGTKTGVCSICNEEVSVSVLSLGHDYSDLKFEYEPTCTTDGRKSKECSRCGSKTSIEIIPATGHSFGDWEQVDDAECGEYGRFERACSNCNQVNVMSAPVEHDYSLENILIEATCTTDGSKAVECSLCGDTTTETIPATGHNHETEIIAPTCTEQGYTIYTCGCGDTYVDDYIDATGHNHTSEITTPATHTTTGIMIYTCYCGDSYTETIEEIAEHNYESVVTAPTCTEQGYTTYTCECSDTYVDDYVDVLGHTPAESVRQWPANPTCTENGSIYEVVYCSVCEEEISRELIVIEATGHADNDNDGNCDNCEEQLCDHNCHKNGFFWKILNFINRLFGLNKVCECGVSHY